MSVYKKSIVTFVNTTGVEYAIGGVAFLPGTPVVIYRRKSIFGDPDACSNLLEKIANGEGVAHSFNATVTPLEDARDTVAQVNSEFGRSQIDPSFSIDYSWLKLACCEMVDGLKKQVDAFDWEAVGVTISKIEFYTTAHPVVTALVAGYLDIATALLEEVPTQSEPEFFTQTRKSQFMALFNSALVSV
jgi:hypothetical protein